MKRELFSLFEDILATDCLDFFKSPEWLSQYASSFDITLDEQDIKSLVDAGNLVIAHPEKDLSFFKELYQK